ncbi:MAG: hypothetical protein SOR89_03535 [Ndongobacter sp.]|nr:hypothetical protein [Ndongobacter sp.]
MRKLKRMLGLILCICMLIPSMVPVYAEGGVQESDLQIDGGMKSPIFNYIQIRFKSQSMVDAIREVRVGEQNYGEAADRYSISDKQYYKADSDAALCLSSTGLSNGSEIKLVTEKGTTTVTIRDLNSMINIFASELSFVPAEAGAVDDDPEEEAEEPQAQPAAEELTLTSTKSQNFEEISVSPQSGLAMIKGVEVESAKNGRVTYSLGESKYSVYSTDKYFVDSEFLYTSLLETGNVVILKGESGELGRYRFTDGSMFGPGSFEKISSENSVGPQEPPVVTPDEPQQPEEADITMSVQAGFSDFILRVNPAEAAGTITQFSVNGKAFDRADSKWTAWSPYKYYIDEKTGEIYLMELKDKDVVALKAGEKKLGTFQYDAQKKALTAVSEEETTQTFLKVRLVGSFESAMVNQKKYDGISGASGSISANSNSSVTVQVAEVANEQDIPAEDAWVKMCDSSIRFAKGSQVLIDAASGMRGIYSTTTSSLILNGEPKQAGKYEVKVRVVDELGRTAESNALSFHVWGHDEKLANHLLIENAKPMKDGRLAWDMEPWSITQFGGDRETVVVPSKLAAWFGSHESGKYGELGVPSKTGTTQTLIIDRDTDLELIHMLVHGSVNIVVRNGGKLRLLDSSVHGTITVEDGGIFTMNYDEHSGKFLTGAQINGQLILKKGAVLENAAIYSNTNSLADGKLIRQSEEPVVLVEGDSVVRGSVFIRGDEAPPGNAPGKDRLYTGQPSMTVQNATLTLSDGALLGVYGGGRFALTSIGGPGMILDHGNVDGNGKLIAIGGSGFGSDGGAGVSGVGEINVAEAYLQGGNVYRKGCNPGKPYADGAKIGEAVHGVAKEGRVLAQLNDDDQPGYWHNILTMPPVEACDTTGAPFIAPAGSGEDVSSSSEAPQESSGEQEPQEPGSGSEHSSSEAPQESSGASSEKTPSYSIRVTDMNVNDLPEALRSEYKGWELEAYNIEVLDETGKAVQPAVPVAVQVTLRGIGTEDLKVLHVRGDHSAEEVKYSLEGRTVRFTGTDFSPFLFVNRKSDVQTVTKAVSPKTGDAGVLSYAAILAVSGAAYISGRRRAFRDEE